MRGVRAANPNIVDVFEAPAPTGYEYDHVFVADDDVDALPPPKRGRDIGLVVPGLPSAPGGGGGGSTDGLPSINTREGVFLYDWENGTPYDGFDFAALQRHLKRKVDMLADPIIKFVSDIAVKTGTSVDHMLVNRSAPPLNAKRSTGLPPAVKTDAKTVEELLSGSNLDSALLVPLLAATLTEVLKKLAADAAVTTRVKREDLEEFVEAIPSKKADNGKGKEGDGSFATSFPSDNGKGKEEEGDGDENDVSFATPLKKFVLSAPPLLQVKKEEKPFSPAKKMSAYIGEAVTLLQSHKEGPTMMSMMMTPELIGPQYGGQGRQVGPNNNNNNNPLLDEMIRVMTHYNQHSSENVDRWAWNNMPENVGMALVRPEVIGAIEGAHQDIGGSRRFKLWHLMTSPGVRHYFAEMIAGALNATPSEIQYPHYTRNVRDNGAVNGARVSSGFWTHARSAKMYQKGIRIFQSVSYGPSSKWVETQVRQSGPCVCVCV
jgi:hypothetical protein